MTFRLYCLNVDEPPCDMNFERDQPRAQPDVLLFRCEQTNEKRLAPDQLPTALLETLGSRRAK